MKKHVLPTAVLLLTFCITGCSSTLSQSVQRTVMDSVNESVQQTVDEIVCDTVGAALEMVMEEVSLSVPASLQEIATPAIQSEMSKLRDYEDFDDLILHRKIDIFSPEGTLLGTITDRREIIDFVRKERMEEWLYFRKIPKDAEALYHFLTWQEEREGSGTLVKNSIDTLYRSKDGRYFICMEIADKSIPYSDVSLKVEIPEEVAHFLIQTAEGQEVEVLQRDESSLLQR